MYRNILFINDKAEKTWKHIIDNAGTAVGGAGMVNVALPSKWNELLIAVEPEGVITGVGNWLSLIVPYSLATTAGRQFSVGEVYAPYAANQRSFGIVVATTAAKMSFASNGTGDASHSYYCSIYYR